MVEVILLERVGRLGNIGDIVKVKPGYARNFLLPQNKALRATEANKKVFEAQRAHIEAENQKAREAAQEFGDKLNGQSFVLIRQAGEAGQLYGSVAARDIAIAATEAGFAVSKGQVLLNSPIKTIGVHSVTIRLHAEVEATVSANVARTAEEANRQAEGEDVIATRLAEERAASDAQAQEIAENAVSLEGEENRE